MPSIDSSSSTNAWARVQSPFASHQRARSGAGHDACGAFSTSDAVNSAAFILLSPLLWAWRRPREHDPWLRRLQRQCFDSKPSFSNVKWIINGYSTMLMAVSERPQSNVTPSTRNVRCANPGCGRAGDAAPQPSGSHAGGRGQRGGGGSGNDHSALWDQARFAAGELQSVDGGCRGAICGGAREARLAAEDAD